MSERKHGNLLQTLNVTAIKCHVNTTCINPLTHNDDYSGRTAPLNSKRCILCIYSTNVGTEYF